MKISQYNPPPPPSVDSSAAGGKSLNVNQGAQQNSGQYNQYGKSTSSFASGNSSSAESQPVGISDAELQDLINEIPADAGSQRPDRMKNDPFFQFMQGLSGDDREAMMAFHQKIGEAAKGGTLDAESLSALAENAPAALKDFCASQGITVEDFIQKDVERAKNRPEMPPPSALQQEMMEFFKSEGIDPKSGDDGGMRDFMRQLMEASSGNGDLSSLAENAPQALKDFAENKGIEVSELLSQITQDIQTNRPPGGGPKQPE